MKIAIPKETAPFETRVAATPETVRRLIKEGFEVLVEKDAGKPSFISDEDYREAGAGLVASQSDDLYSQADFVFKVQGDEPERLKPNSWLIAFLNPLLETKRVQVLAERRITAFSVDMVPRIARAQKLDGLSSQSNVAGYKAVLMAANAIPKMMPMMMTAAGTVTPAKVFVIGAGVAGLQAIATAKRLGAIVSAYDTRPVVKEQVESLGGKFVQLTLDAGQAEDARGYAKELSEDAKKQSRELVAQQAAQADIVITTALIPGKPAPKLISEAMVKSMRQGSVIVDLAADGGGNCELTQAGKDVVMHGVTIIGRKNVPGLVANQSSQLYARNVLNLFLEMAKDKACRLDLENEIIKGALITHEGQIVHEMLKGVKV